MTTKTRIENGDRFEVVGWGVYDCKSGNAPEKARFIGHAANRTDAEMIAKALNHKNEGGMRLCDLQARQAAWVAHNFRQQYFGQSAEEIERLIHESRREGEGWADVTARLARDGKIGVSRSYGLLGVVEEGGELVEALLAFAGLSAAISRVAQRYIKAERGIRGTPEEHRAAMEDAVGDVVIFLASFCNTPGIEIDLDAVVERTWAEVERRDWVKYPDTGLPPERGVEP